jgi:hypothetical protein
VLAAFHKFCHAVGFSPIYFGVLKFLLWIWALVAHTYNPRYSGGRDQEDHGSKPPRQIVLETLSQKYPSQKGLVEWLKVQALSSNPSTAKDFFLAMHSGSCL